MSKRILREIYQWVVAVPKELLALVVAAVVALNYAALYLVYFRFYVPFGLRPADVGLTRLRLLQESVLGPTMIIFWRVAEHWVLFLVGFVVVIVAIELYARRPGERPARTWGERAALVVCLSVVSSLVLVVSGYRQLAIEARALGNDVRRDGHIVIGHVKRPWNWPALDLQAIPVTVVASDIPDEGMTDGCLLYLGRANGLVQIFDVRKDAVISTPEDGTTIVLEVDNNNFAGGTLPDGCLSEDGNTTNPIEEP